jgi:hypothetical protein
MLFPITTKAISNLHDKLYDKRKLGALEVEVVLSGSHSKAFYLFYRRACRK